MTPVYDAGALIAADRGDREIWATHRRLVESGLRPITTAPVVAQVSRTPQQARLRMLLNGCQVMPFLETDGHPVGRLLRLAGTSDVVDGHVVHIAGPREIFTSDSGDLEVLAEHSQHRPPIRPV